MKRVSIVALVAVSMLSILACATAGTPDWQLEPSYGTVTLSSGFRPDPHLTELVAGGDIDLSSMGFTGFVAEGPDLDLYYEAGQYELFIYVAEQDADTVLLINDPEGSWHFSDDVIDTRPGIRFEAPQSGLYDIWVGTYGSELVDASVAISEISWERAEGTGGPNWELEPAYGSVELAGGFKRDPYVVEMVAGGPLDLADSLGFTGFVAEAPDFDLYYEGNDSLLYIYVTNASADTVLLVNAPDGEWHFNDDANGLDPGIVFQGPPSGLYDIWVGTIDPENTNVELVISKSSW